MPRADEDYGYRSRSYADAKKHRDTRGGGFDSYVRKDFKLYKVKDGKNLIRIMQPTWDDADHYALEIWVNYSVGPDNVSYLSLIKMKGEPDPLDEARREADREDDEELAKQLAPKQRALMWIIDRENEDEGPQLWAAPKTVDSDILSISMDDDNNSLVEIDHPIKGQDLRFYREGKGLNTKYPAAKMRLMAPAPLHEDPKQRKEWVDFIKENPLPETLQFHTYDHIAKVFNGHTAKPKAADDEPDERPTAKVKVKAKPQPEDDDVPFDDEPKPRARNRPSVDNDEAEPEEKPRPKSAKARDDDEDEEGSIRSRLAERRRAKADDDDSGDD